MACHRPINIRVKDTRINVPCGRCAACLSNKRNEWTFRLTVEERHSRSAHFVTMTYNDSHLPIKQGTATLLKSDLQKYFKRVRKHTKDLRYYAVGEYGEKYQRPHYHAIVFNAERDVLIEKWKDREGKEIGNIQVDKVTQASIHYCTKYIAGQQNLKEDEKQKPFAAMSKGLGKKYVETHKHYHIENMETEVTYRGGNKHTIPRYLKEKIFNDDQKEQLSIKNRLKYPAKIADEKEYEKIISKRKAQNVKNKRSGKSNYL